MLNQWVVGCLAAAAAVSTSARGAVILEKLVADGDIEPVTGLRYKLGSSGHSANAGRIFLDVTLSGSGVTAGNDRAWLYGDAAAPRLLFREGDPLPGHPAGTRIAYAGGTVGPTGWYGLRVLTETSGTFAAVIGDGATSSIVARTGDVAPGTGGNTMHTTWVENVVSSTQYTLMSYLPKPAGALTYPAAYYRTKSDGSLQLMAQTTTHMPQLLPENRSILITHSKHGQAHSMWTLAYETPDYPYGSSRRGLFLSRDSGHTLVIKEGDPQPVTPTAGAYAPRALWLGANGDYVFASGFHDTATNYYYGVGLYAGNPTSYSMRRLPGQVFLDQPGYRAEDIYLFDSTDAGRIAFSGRITDNATSKQLINILAIGDADHGFETIAQHGTSTGLEGGETFTRFGNQSGAGLWMNDEGDVMFLSFLGGTGVGAANDSSLWLYDDESDRLTMLAREGQEVLVNGTLRTIGSLEYTNSSFDASGDPIFSLLFTDNTRGFFAARVPEPAGAVTVLTLLACGVARRSRQRGERRDITPVA